LRTIFPVWRRGLRKARRWKSPIRQTLCPPCASHVRKVRKLVKPDIMAQLKETWGDRVFSTKEVAEMRAAELEDEEG